MLKWPYYLVDEWFYFNLNSVHFLCFRNDNGFYYCLFGKANALGNNV